MRIHKTNITFNYITEKRSRWVFEIQLINKNTTNYNLFLKPNGICGTQRGEVKSNSNAIKYQILQSIATSLIIPSNFTKLINIHYTCKLKLSPGNYSPLFHTKF